MTESPAFNKRLNQLLVFGLVDPLICAWTAIPTLISILFQSRRFLRLLLPCFVVCLLPSTVVYYKITTLALLSFLFVPERSERNVDFDVIFSVGAYNIFGDTEEMLPNIISYVKKGGYIALAFPGLKSEFGDNVPQEMQPFWAVPEVAKTVRGIEWWKDLFSKADGIEIINISEQACHDIAWEEYIASIDPNSEDKWTLDMKAAEDGKYFNTIQLVAKII